MHPDTEHDPETCRCDDCWERNQQEAEAALMRAIDEMDAQEQQRQAA